MKKLILVACCISLLSALCWGKDQQCVNSDEAVAAWDNAVSHMERSAGGSMITTTECDPCKCPVNGMTSCYEFMAIRERMKEFH